MQDDWKKYLHFFSLRSHGIIENIPKTEVLYIHSKLMIVDDKSVIIGSANINDRSMLGSRDSEIGVIINGEEDDKIQSMMDGKIYEASKFALTLRVRLMKEHLGMLNHENENNNQNINENKETLISEDILVDPVSDKLFTTMKRISMDNTEYYRKIFNCYPDNKFNDFESIDEFERVKEMEDLEYHGHSHSENKVEEEIITEKINERQNSYDSGNGMKGEEDCEIGSSNGSAGDRYRNKYSLASLKENYKLYSGKIVGNIVDFPLDFLKDECLSRSYFCKEKLVPIKNFL